MSAHDEARRAYDTKTKPRGSLGRLEDLGCRLAEIRGFVPARLDAAIVVAAGDHGVAAEGVSAYPQEVTAQMVANFAAGGAAINVLARHAGARLIDVDAALVCGRGTGLDDDGVARKIETVRRALEVNAGRDPLAELGGFEIAFLAGVVLGCERRRIAVLLDGFITGAAALAAARISPSAAGVMIASHRSPEPGHALVLEALGLEPLLDLGLRLGEGSGAALALPLLHASIAILSEMATFGDAGVTDAGR